MSIVSVELYSINRKQISFGNFVWFGDLAMNGIFCGVVLRKRDGIFLLIRCSVVCSSKQIIYGYFEIVCQRFNVFKGG